MIAKVETVKRKFNMKAVKKILIDENKFLTDLCSILPIPVSALQTEDPSDFLHESTEDNKLIEPMNRAPRAVSLEDLQNRLMTIQTKKRLSYKEKLLKKGLKTRMKKKTKLAERNSEKKILRAQKMTTTVVKTETNADTKPKLTKPIFNSEGKMVFSKFDFVGLGNKQDKKVEKDPKKILKNIVKQNAKLNELKEKGEQDKVKEIKEKHLWKNALAKAEGQKVKDDPLLLKKSIKKKEQLKKKSQKKWQAREEGVKRSKEDRQKKRTDNIAKKQKEKKVHKMKQAVKRGRIVPGM